MDFRVVFISLSIYILKPLLSRYNIDPCELMTHSSISYHRPSLFASCNSNLFREAYHLEMSRKSANTAIVNLTRFFKQISLCLIWSY